MDTQRVSVSRHVLTYCADVRAAQKLARTEDRSTVPIVLGSMRARGRLLSGAQPLESFVWLIEEELMRTRAAEPEER